MENIYSKYNGSYFNFLGYFFSIYCVWKIFIVSMKVNAFNAYIVGAITSCRIYMSIVVIR